MELAAAGIGLHVNAHKTEYMCYNQTGDISTLHATSLKVGDKLTYLGSSVSSAEKDIDTRLTKAWTAIDSLSIIWKSELTLSHHFSQSFIASGRSSGLHPVSSYSCCMYVRAGRPAFARPCVGVHCCTPLKSSSPLLQQCPVCLVRLTWIVFVMRGRWRIVGVLWVVVPRTCSILLAAFLCNFRLASSRAVLLESM